MSLLVFVFFWERESSGSNRTPPRALVLFVAFLLFAPPRLAYRPFWPCVLSPGVFSGCHSGPRVFFGFSWNLQGLSSLSPSEALSGCEAARVFLRFLFVVFVFPFLFCFAAARVFLESQSRWSHRRGQERVISPAPRPSEGKGVPLEGGGLVPFLCCYCLVSCVWVWAQGPRRILQVWRRCPFRVAFWALARTFWCSLPEVFFSGPWGPLADLDCQTQCENCYNSQDLCALCA